MSIFALQVRIVGKTVGENRTLAEYLYCKSLLFRQCKFAAANIDDPAWKDITKDCTGEVFQVHFPLKVRCVRSR